MSRSGWILLLAAVLVAGACAGDDDSSVPPDTTGDGPDETEPVTDASATTAPDTEADPPEGAATTVYERGAVDSGLAPFVRRATDDLSMRLGIGADAIEALTTVLLTLPPT